MSRRAPLEASPPLAGHQLPPAGVSHEQRLAALRSYIPQGTETAAVTTRGMEAAQKLAAFRARVSEYMPSREICIKAYAGVLYIKRIAEINPNIDEDLFWGFGSVYNFFSTDNFISSNENFIQNWVGVLGMALMEGRANNTLTDMEKESFNAMIDVVNYQVAMKKLQENVPEWRSDDRYGEFSSW